MRARAASFAGQQALLADVGEASRADAERDEVSSVDVRNPGLGELGVEHGWSPAVVKLAVQEPGVWLGRAPIPECRPPDPRTQL